MSSAPDDLPWPELGNVSRGATRGNQPCIMNLQHNAGTSVSSFFKHASRFVVKENTMLDVGRDVNVYISGPTRAKPGQRQRDEGLKDGPEVISLNSLDLKKELRNGGVLGYRIHLAQQRQNPKKGCGAVIVKTFEGPSSKKRHAATVAFMRRFFHPNIARLVGVSSCSANTPYIVYRGGVSTCRIQALIAKDLRAKLELGIVSSLRFTKGIAAAISYLQNQGISLQSLVPGGSFENLDVLAGEDGEAVLTMSAGVVDNSSNVPLSSSTMVTSEDGWKLFNDLCQQTLQEVNYILHQDSPHRILSRGDLSRATQSTELNNPELQTTSPLTVSLPGQPKTRREVRWEADADYPQSLDILAQRFQDDIDSCGSLRRLTVPNSWLPVWHQCPGYLREEVNLCADLSQSAVLTYAAPAPNERCTICGELVLILESDLERDFHLWFTQDYGREIGEGEIDFEENFDHFTDEDFDYFDQFPTRTLLDAPYPFPTCA